ncbi:MAG: methyltransferase domain-containing protein [bacterium]|nr:methyltransferase domain-containing protein [bacterium]
MNRSGSEYISNFNGVKTLFEYTKKLQSQVILDLGAGTARAIREISESNLGSGLVFSATVLRHSPEITKYLGISKVHISPVETLRGVADSSIGCVLANLSIAYSVSPNLAVKSIDRVLVPGGALKAVFPSLTQSIKRAGVLQDSRIFKLELESIGYDTYENRGPQLTVLLAVKPGKAIEGAAQNLYFADELTVFDQLTDFVRDRTTNRAGG